jgi:hypothetical protein
MCLTHGLVVFFLSYLLCILNHKLNSPVNQKINTNTRCPPPQKIEDFKIIVPIDDREYGMNIPTQVNTRRQPLINNDTP